MTIEEKLNALRREYKTTADPEKRKILAIQGKALKLAQEIENDRAFEREVFQALKPAKVINGYIMPN